MFCGTPRFHELNVVLLLLPSSTQFMVPFAAKEYLLPRTPKLHSSIGLESESYFVSEIGAAPA